MSRRYCYIVESKEVDIVGVYSSKKKAIDAAEDFIKFQGVTKHKVNKINDEFVQIVPLEYDTYEEAVVLRFVVQ